MNCPFEDQVLRAWPIARWQTTRVLLAVSGGADSVAMLRCLVELSPARELLEVAHFNHGWRGSESDGDAQFVCQMAQQYGLRFHLGSPSAAGAKSEQAARDLRYQFLSRTAYSVGARYVVAAHTSDDCVETMLHNLFRGTGLDGVRPLDTTRPLDAELVLVRPLLGCSRADVLNYLHAKQQDYREDSSNNDLTFRRNFLRQSVLPLVRSQYGAGLDERLLSFGEIVAETEDLVQDLASRYWADAQGMSAPAAVQPSSTLAFPSRARLAVAWPVLRAALVAEWHRRGWSLGRMSRSHWEHIRRLHEQDPPETSSQVRRNKQEGQLPGSLQLSSCDGWILIKS